MSKMLYIWLTTHQIVANLLNINNYKNIWADHQRNDLKKIEFIVGDDFLPQKILIYFKERVFKLEKN